MKKEIKIVLAIALVIIVLGALSWWTFYPGKAASDQNLPDKYIVKERMTGKIFGPSSFRIKDEKGQYGKVVRDVFSPITTTFSYENANGDLVAKGVKQFFSWGTKIDFQDGNGKFIGAINEKVTRSLLKWYTDYTVFDKDGKEVGRSEKTEYFQTEITLSDLTGKTIAIIKKDYFNVFRDTWNVEVFQKDKVDVRILPIIAAYKTYSDNKKENKSSSKKKWSILQ